MTTSRQLQPQATVSRFLLWSLLVMLVRAQECSDLDETCQVSEELECGVYMAPSTIGEFSNMGIYTGMDLKKGDIVNYPEIAVPILFRTFDSKPKGEDDGDLWHRYIWEGYIMEIEPMIDYDRGSQKTVFVPGVGCTINSVLDMYNIDSTHGSVYDTAGLHRSKDPGAGAFSPYHEATTRAAVDIRAGDELFASYGDYWIPYIPDAVVSFDHSMDEGDEYIEGYADFASTLPAPVAEGLWNFTRDFPLASHTLSVMPKRDWKIVEHVLHHKEIIHSSAKNSVVRHFIREDGKRNLDWLKEHGKCQDHIKPGRSTITQAGRGAFAARALPKGTVVGFAPLIHIGDARYILEVEYSESSNYTTEDLIINYSFGHRDSTMLLTPYGAMVNYINHHKERANVKVQWPDKELIPHKPEWLEKDVDFFANHQGKIGLSFDYVALRDIEEGEELFMDYGEEWEEAWEEHVKNWKPILDPYTHKSDLDEDYLRTLEEQSENPYPNNLITLCIPSYGNEEEDGARPYIEIETRARVDCDVISRAFDDVGELQYTVLMYVSQGDPVIVKNVSESGAALYDKSQSADWHLPTAFRHEIMIPDEIFPKSWKNRN